MANVRVRQTITEDEAASDTSTQDMGIPEDGPITPSPVPEQEGSSDAQEGTAADTAADTTTADSAA